jgi:prepilin-type N-terminal cleavage/methylation domain-containing protein
MAPIRAKHLRSGGFTFIEIAIAMALLGLVVAGVTSSFWKVQTAFAEEVTDAEMTFRARGAMDRIVRVTGNAVTSDDAFALLPFSGPPEWGLRFRELISVVNGVPIYDDVAVVHIIGPNGGVSPSDGLLIGHGPNLDAIFNAAAGVDGVLGTEDDDVTVEFAPGVPAVELLIPAEFAPEVGSMLTVSDTATTSGRLITITLRTNFLQPNGTYVRSTDFVLEERIALRW